MDYRITGLSPEPFAPLFGLTDAALARNGAQSWVAGPDSRQPDRIGMRDAEPGETLLLVNHVHQPADTPYRASHAIFVREGATQAYDRVGVVPEVMRSRMLSLRAFDRAHLMVDAELVDGRESEAAIRRLLADARVEYLQAHYATRGTSPAPPTHFPADRRLVAFGIRVEAGRVGSFLRRAGILVASFVIGAPEHWQDDRNDPVADHQSADDHDDLGPGHGAASNCRRARCSPRRPTVAPSGGR